ncbi:MAG: hypothetical protein Kow0090_11150 [Myxococcota bacterium]
MEEREPNIKVSPEDYDKQTLQAFILSANALKERFGATGAAELGRGFIAFTLALAYALHNTGKISVLEDLFMDDTPSIPKPPPKTLLALLKKFKPTTQMESFLESFKGGKFAENFMLKNAIEQLLKKDSLFIDFSEFDSYKPGKVYEELSKVPAEELVIKGRTPSKKAKNHPARKSYGSFYTPVSLVKKTVERTLKPLVERAQAERSPDDLRPEDFYKLRIFDPAMGCGFFLIEAADFMAREIFSLVCSVRDESSPAESFAEIRKQVIFNTLYGVDIDETAVAITQLVLWGLAGDPTAPMKPLEERVTHGDSLALYAKNAQ